VILNNRRIEKDQEEARAPAPFILHNLPAISSPSNYMTSFSQKAQSDVGNSPFAIARARFACKKTKRQRVVTKDRFLFSVEYEKRSGLLGRMSKKSAVGVTSAIR
jgi:hypothetical protein